MKLIRREKAIREGGSKSRIIDVGVPQYERAMGKAYQPADYQALVNQYESWVYVCITKNSNAIARFPLKLFVAKKKGKRIIATTKVVELSTRKFFETQPHLLKYINNMEDMEEVTEHPLLDLFNKVNPIMNRFDLFTYTNMFMELTGNAYWYVVKGKMGLPEQIWPLLSQNVIVAVKKESTEDGNFISGYLYRNGMDEVPFDVGEIVHFKFPSPYSMIYGKGPLSACMLSVSFDRSSKEFEVDLMKNRGMPDGILETEQTIKDPDFQRLKKEWIATYGGRKNIGKMIVMDKGLKYQQLTISPREMNFLAGRKTTKEEIAAVFGVPVSKLTTEDVNLANASIGETQYIRDTLDPRLRSIEEKVNEQLCPIYDESIFVSYGDVIPQDRNYALLELDKHLSTGYSTINEKRKKDGLDPVEWGDKPIMQAGMVHFGEPPSSAPTSPGEVGAPKPAAQKPNVAQVGEEGGGGLPPAISGKPTGKPARKIPIPAGMKPVPTGKRPIPLGKRPQASTPGGERPLNFREVRDFVAHITKGVLEKVREERVP